MTSRRAFLTGLAGTVICAPAIVRAASLMPVKPLPISIISPGSAYISEPWVVYRHVQRLKFTIPEIIPGNLIVDWEPFDISSAKEGDQAIIKINDYIRVWKFVEGEPIPGGHKVAIKDITTDVTRSNSA